VADAMRCSGMYVGGEGTATDPATRPEFDFMARGVENRKFFPQLPGTTLTRYSWDARPPVGTQRQHHKRLLRTAARTVNSNFRSCVTPG